MYLGNCCLSIPETLASVIVIGSQFEDLNPRAAGAFFQVRQEKSSMVSLGSVPLMVTATIDRIGAYLLARDIHINRAQTGNTSTQTEPAGFPAHRSHG
jgi:hypothetical protein